VSLARSNGASLVPGRWIDYAFAVSGCGIERNYPEGLYAALRRHAPWLDDEPLAAVHPLRGLTEAGEALLLGGRSRLMLRLPEARGAAAGELQGCRLDLPAPLLLGPACRRELLPYPVLHARLVVTGTGDEAQFVADVAREVEALGLDCDLIVGRRGELVLGAMVHAGFSLMLHGLSAADSLAAQAQGVGSHRKFGCGVFVPHRSVAPVGL